MIKIASLGFDLLATENFSENLHSRLDIGLHDDIITTSSIKL